MESFWLNAIALPATVGLILLLRQHAARLGLMDKPGGRKQHQGATPLVGGLAIFGGIVVAALTQLLSGQQFDTRSMAFLLALVVLVASGVLDDRHDLKPVLRFLIQIVAVSIMIHLGNVRLDSLGNLLGLGDIELGPWSVPMTIFSVLGVISAINMIDGIDGLAGVLSLTTVVALCGFAFAAGLLEQTPLMAMAFALVGFLPFNLRSPWRDRASVFLGETGSVLLGFVLAWHMVQFAGEVRAFTPITAVWILAIPLMDTVSLMFRRALLGRSPLAPDREHLHHILQRAGFTPGETVMIVMLLSILFATIGLVGWWLEVPEYVMFYGFMSLFVLYCFGVSRAWKLMKLARRTRDGQEDRSAS